MHAALRAEPRCRPRKACFYLCPEPPFLEPRGHLSFIRNTFRLSPLRASWNTVTLCDWRAFRDAPLHLEG